MRIRLYENQESDNQGNILSPEQLQFFKNSKVRDNSGHLLVCYHGTPNPGFKEFNPVNSKSQFGKYKFNMTNVNYFTTNLQAASSYTEMGYESNNNVYYCYVNIENPFIVNNETLSDIKNSFNIKDSRLRDQQRQILDDIKITYEYDIQDAIDNGDDVDDILDIEELNQWFSYVGCKIIQNGDYYDLVTLGNNSLFGSGNTVAYVEELSDFFMDDSIWDEIEDYLVDGDDYYLSTDDVVKLVLYMNRMSGTNYDGIIIDDIVDSKDMFADVGMDIITLKSSNQIKLVDNIAPTNSNKIDESFQKLADDIFITDSVNDIYNLITNKPKFYRILYDSLIDKYMICDGNDYIHFDMLNKAFAQGYYESIKDFIDSFTIYSTRDISCISAYNEMGNSGLYEDDVEQDVWLFNIIFNPDKDWRLGDDDYTSKYELPYGELLVRYDMLENVPELYKKVSKEIINKTVL